MARQSIKITIGQSLPGGVFNTSGGQAGVNGDTTTVAANVASSVAAGTTADTSMATVVGADQTATEAAVALLEADGATPTQAHVNSLRTVWNTTKADCATTKTNTAAVVTANTTLSGNSALLATAIGGDLLVNWDTTKITTMNQLRAAFAEALRAAQGGGILTP